MSDYQFQYNYQINPADYFPQSGPPHHYHSWPPDFLYPFSRPSPVISVQKSEEYAIIFVISSVFFSICGAFLGGAAVNYEWTPKDWNWNDPETSVGILSGAVGGLLLPYGFFYSNATIGVKGTMLMASGGAYLGAAMINKRWDPFQYPGWNWTTPKTYYGAFEGMQSAVWLIDATSSIHAFTDEFGLQGPVRGAFIVFSYGIGLVIAYHYVSLYHNGNYQFWEWDRIHEPGTLFAALDGVESGTRLPVGFAEIGIGLANRTSATITGPHGSSFGFHVGKNTFKVDPWSIFGAGFMSFVYASEENTNLNIKKWDWRSFSTLEAILNGIVYGKDLPEMVMDVMTRFQQRQSSLPGKPLGWSWHQQSSKSRE